MDVIEDISKSLEIADTLLEFLPPLQARLLSSCVPLSISSLNLMKSKLTDLKDREDFTELNLIFLKGLIERLLFYLNELSKLMTIWEKSFGEEEDEDLLIFTSKFDSFNDILDTIPYVSKTDLISLEKTDPRWTKLAPVSSIFSYSKPKKVTKHYKNFMVQVAVANAFMAVGLEEKSLMEKKIMVGIGAMYYWVFKSEAVRRTKIFIANPRIDVAQNLWNLVDSWMVSHLMSLMMPSVKINKVMYIPRTVSHILNQENYPLNVNQRFKENSEDDLVMTRFICSFDPVSKEKLEGIFCCAGRRDKADRKSHHYQLVFHIHGGGFVSMSSASHQVYTRKWAKQLGIPVFSIDYRLAPKNPYPDALDDVWQAYNWVINNAKDQLGINPAQIILAGDSAGGNLALALTYKCILSNFRIPDGLLLGYPALNLSKKHYTPSMLFSLEDFLVPHTFLKLVRSYYTADPSLDLDNDIFISPIAASPDILQHLPPIRILVGQCDPFHDDCYRFTEKLIDAGRDVKLKEFEGTPHGAFSFCFAGGVKESYDVLHQSIEWLRELFLIRKE